jgi:undecaprenyl-diphosphatase
VTASSDRRAGDVDETGAAGRSRRWRAWLARFIRNWAIVVALGTLALLGFAKVGEDVFAHESTSFDGAVQGWMLAHQYPLLDKLFVAITIVGGITGMCVLALAGAAYLWYRGHRRVGSGVLLAPVVAITLFNVVKRLYARPRPVGLGGRVDSSYSFPSGHSTSAAAVCCTLAYVMWREGYIGGRTALAFAIVAPLLIGLSRLYLNVHWATDVLGGWSVGLFVAVLSASLYNHHRRRRSTTRDAAVRTTSTQSTTS